MYKKVKANQVPKRGRKSESRFEKTPEWLALKADIDNKVLKVKKDRDALLLSLTDENKEKMGITNRRTVVRFIEKYLDEHSLEYEVKSFRKDDMDHVVILLPE